MSQDWETVTLGKKTVANTKGAKSAQVAAASRAGTLQVEKRFAGGENKSAHSAPINARALEESEELRRECR